MPRSPIVAVAALGLAGTLVVGLPLLRPVTRQPVSTRAASIVTAVEGQQDVALPFAASHVALHWTGNPNAAVTIAFGTVAGRFGDAAPVEADAGSDADSPIAQPGQGAPAEPETYGQVAVAGGARYVRLTSDRPLARLTVVAMDTGATGVAAAADAVAIAGAVPGDASAAVTKPTVISRAAWGADESLRFDSGGYEREARNFFPLQKLVVHHTAGANNDPDPAATIRAIYYDHAVIRDLGDIDYNFLIDAQGRVYEGRYSRAYAPGEPITGEDLAGNPVRGTHAGGYNAGTVGIALLGTFTSVQPTTAARASLITLLAWEAERHGIDPLGSSLYRNPESGITKFLPNIIGHRDVDATACPGDAFYATFPTLRTQVAAMIAATTGPGVDSTAPTGVLSPMLTPTGGQTMTFGLPFREPVTGLAPEDFTVSGGSNGWSVASVTGEASTYTVTLHSSAPTDGSVVLTLAANSVTDLAGNTGPPTDLEATATFATDTVAPSVVLWATPHSAAVKATSIDVHVAFSEPVLGLSLSKLDIGGTSSAVTPWTSHLLVGSYADYEFTVSAENPANGTLTLAIPAGATTDPAGNPNTAAAISILIDRTAPKTSVPTVGLRTGIAFGGTSLAGRVTWTASDAGGAGLGSYDVERSVDGGPWSVIESHFTGTSLGVRLSSGHTYRYAVRARDKAGNVGSWRVGSTTSTVVRQDGSGYIHYAGTWHTGSSSSYSGGTVHDAAAASASASYAFTGRSVAFVTTLASSRGQVRVYLDGALVTTVDTGSSSVAYRRILWSRTWSSAGIHTLRLVVVGTVGRPRVDLDALLVLR